MGYIASREALQLVCHYFGDITPQQQASFQSVWKDGCVSPAALEALCAECEDVKSLLQGVAVLVRHSAAVAVSVADGKEAAGATAASDVEPDVGKTLQGAAVHGNSSAVDSTKSSSVSSCPAPAESEGLESAVQDAGLDVNCCNSDVHGAGSDSDCRVIIDTDSSHKVRQLQSAVKSHALSILAEVEEGVS